MQKQLFTGLNCIHFEPQFLPGKLVTPPIQKILCRFVSFLWHKSLTIGSFLQKGSKIHPKNEIFRRKIPEIHPILYLQFDSIHLIFVLGLKFTAIFMVFRISSSLSQPCYSRLVILGWWRYSSKSSDFFQVWWKKFVILHHKCSRYQFLSGATNLVSDKVPTVPLSRHATDIWLSSAPN